jgi:hypothetical protein
LLNAYSNASLEGAIDVADFEDEEKLGNGTRLHFPNLMPSVEAFIYTAAKVRFSFFAATLARTF